jgi:hypothetical protein
MNTVTAFCFEHHVACGAIVAEARGEGRRSEGCRWLVGWLTRDVAGAHTHVPSHDPHPP